MTKSKLQLPTVALGLLFLLFSACLAPSPLFQTSSVTVMGTVEPMELDEVVQARITLSKGKQVVEAVVPLVAGEFQATLNVPVGQWELTVFLVDQEGKVRFQNKAQTTSVVLGQPNLVDLVLRPADGKILIEINLTDFIFRDLALRARIHFDDLVHEVIRPDSSAPFQANLSLAPGSYEFKIELYTGSFRSSDRLGPGIWQTIHLAPNAEMTIEWSPVLEELVITGRVETLLPAPTNLKVTAQSDGALITWDPISHWDVAGYFLYVQTDILERYQLLSTVPLVENSFLHSYDQPENKVNIRYVVAAVTSGGLVGFYSDHAVFEP